MAKLEVVLRSETRELPLCSIESEGPLGPLQLAQIVSLAASLIGNGLARIETWWAFPSEVADVRAPGVRAHKRLFPEEPEPESEPAPTTKPEQGNLVP